MGILFYPYYLVLFWFIELPKTLLRKYAQINSYTLNMLSVPLLLRTFFHPLKNEYREGLVLFSRIAGVVVKTFLLVIGLSSMILLIAIEVIFIVLAVTLPIWLFYLLIIR